MRMPYITPEAPDIPRVMAFCIRYLLEKSGLVLCKNFIYYFLYNTSGETDVSALNFYYGFNKDLAHMEVAHEY